MRSSVRRTASARRSSGKAGATFSLRYAEPGPDPLQNVVWERRQSLRALPLQPSGWGLVLVGGSLVVLVGVARRCSHNLQGISICHFTRDILMAFAGNCSRVEKIQLQIVISPIPNFPDQFVQPLQHCWMCRV